MIDAFYYSLRDTLDIRHRKNFKIKTDIKYIVKSETLRATQGDTQMHTHKEKERERNFILCIRH